MLNMQKMLEVAVIVGPVFAVMGLGRALTERGTLTPEIGRFLNGIAFRFCLPSLILYEVGRGKLSQLAVAGNLVGVPLAAMALLALFFLWFARYSRLAVDEKPAFVFGVFWANIAYLGFPLAQNAFGAEGLALAAVYNATIMPCTTLCGYGVISHFMGSSGNSWRGRIRETFLNPIVASALLGILVMVVSQGVRNADGSLPGGAPIAALFAAIGSFLKMMGGMGLPIALLVVGGSLRFAAMRNAMVPLLMSALARTVVLPLMVYAAFSFFLSDVVHEVRAVSVLLAAMPCSVSSFVIATGRGANARFTASLLALTTAISLVTLPVWLYFLL